MSGEFIDADVYKLADDRLAPYMSTSQFNGALSSYGGSRLLGNGAIVLTSLFFNRFWFNSVKQPSLNNAATAIMHLDVNGGSLQALMYSVAVDNGVEPFDGEVRDKLCDHGGRYAVVDPLNDDNYIAPDLDGGLASWRIVSYMANVIGVAPELFYIPDSIACLKIHNARAGNVSSLTVETHDHESTSIFAAMNGYVVDRVERQEHTLYWCLTLRLLDESKGRDLRRANVAGQPLTKLFVDTSGGVNLDWYSL